mmetsp:Transcript_722/g.883  ORF Transcript_722/g.883 Transcript_722/m.883 type:complete len:391 (+) Transcript_722:333-1505(+)
MLVSLRCFVRLKTGSFQGFRHQFQPGFTANKINLTTKPFSSLGSKLGFHTSQISNARSKLSQIPFPKKQPSQIERKPKVIIAAMAFGISAATISTIVFFESLKYSETEGQIVSDSYASIQEPISGTNFPLNLFGYETQSSVHWLIGSSIRCMLNMCSLDFARAYSYALYISQESLEELQSKVLKHPEDVTEQSFRNFIMPKEPVGLENQIERRSSIKSASKFIPNNAFAGKKEGYVYKLGEEGLGYYLDTQGDAIREMQGVKRYPSAILRLVMLHNVKGDHVAHGFDRTLLWRIRKLQNNNKSGPGKEALRHFTAFLRKEKEWAKGTVVDILRLPHGYISVRVNGKEKLELRSEILSYALLDAYYGEKGHFSKACKDDIVTRTREIINVL